MGVGDQFQFNSQRPFWIQTQAERPRAAADDGAVIEMPEGVGQQPVDFLGADDEAGINPALHQPVIPQGQSLRIGRRVPSQGANQRCVFQQSRHMACGRGKNCLGKQEGAGSGRVFQRLLEKAEGILDAAGLEADHNSDSGMSILAVSN